MGSELKNKFGYQVISSASQLLLPLVTYPYITRVLGPSGLGRINYVDFLAQVFILLSSFGIPYYAVREVAKARHDAVKRSELVTEMLILNLFFSVIATVIFSLLTFKGWSQNPGLYLLAGINILMNTFSFEWYLQATEAFSFSAARTVAVRFLMIIAFYLLVKQETDYTIYYGIFTAAVVILALLNSYRLLSENRLVFKGIHFKKHLKPLWHFFLTSSAISLYIYFDTIILQYLTHDEQAVGYYTTVLKMVKIFLLLILSISTVLLPRLSWLANSGNMAEVNRHLNKMLQFIIVSAIPVSMGLLLLAPEIIVVISGDRFSPAVPLMRILAFLPLVIGLSNLFCYQTLVPFNKEKKFLAIAVIGCIASIGLNFFLIPRLGALGAAIAGLTTELVITIIAGWHAGRLVQFHYKMAMVPQTILSCLLFIPVIITCRYFSHSSFVVLFTAMPACVLIYFICQVVFFKNAMITETKNYFINLFKS